MSLYIKNCELFEHDGLYNVLAEQGRITAIHETGSQHGVPARITHDSNNPTPCELVDAAGGILLPGLHDHHIHLMSFATALHSIACGPPDIANSLALGTALSKENASNTVDWLRGFGYHHSVAGDIDRYWLDQYLPDRPARIQHRGGRMWVINSAGMSQLGLLSEALPADAPSGVEREQGTATGRLFECDQWLREKLNSRMPCLKAASAQLASFGITGITDTTPHNGPDEWHHFAGSQAAGELLQEIRVMGCLALNPQSTSPQLQRGEFKLHLLESALPDLDTLCAAIRKARSAGRNVAFHCVTRTELVFALAALKSTGVKEGDRIEHASVTPPELLPELAGLSLRIVSQPHFIAERGDQYLCEVEPRDQPWLYRLNSFKQQGIPLAGGSDAPFGNPDPWKSMAAATNRQTAKGNFIEKHEALSPEDALTLFTSPLDQPGITNRIIEVGAPADLCLLDRPWRTARGLLSSSMVKATWREGTRIYQRDTQPGN